MPQSFIVFVVHGGPKTNTIPKEALEALPTIAEVAVGRTPLNSLGGCTWTITLIEDEMRLHQGDMPMLQVESSLVGAPSIIVFE
jgi:hypothetical protein